LSHWSVDSEAATRLTTSTFAAMAADTKLGRAAALSNAMPLHEHINCWIVAAAAKPPHWGQRLREPIALVRESTDGGERALPSPNWQMGAPANEECKTAANIKRSIR
jgi:hypothetical protein